MKIAVVDDSAKDRNDVREFILSYSAQNCLSIECDLYAEGKEFLSSARQKNYDIAFLDIFMNSLDGIQTAEIFRRTNAKCLLVFLTSSPEHRACAFCVHAFDYLEKPLQEDNLKKVLDDAFSLLMPKQPYIDVSVGKLSIPILYSDILYVTADSNYLVIQADKEYRCRMSFSSLISVLELDARFVVINRGILVNLDYVAKMENLTCTMNDGTAFPINRKREAALKQEYITRQFARRTKRVSRGGLS